MEFVTLSGTPEGIGLEHGRSLKDKIEATWEFYSQILFGNAMALLEEYGNRYLEAIRRFSADYATEIEAVADGADMPPWQISVLNARTEIFHIMMEQTAAAECTAIYFPGSRILGQNWDWMEQLKDLFVVMQIERDDGHRILQITEPGIIGKIGFSSNGIGACLNIISGGASDVAVPVHILLRYILDADSLDDVVTTFQNVPQGTCSNILAADDRGRCANMEFSGTELEIVDFGEQIPMHTNHYLSHLKEGRDNSRDLFYENSMGRYVRAKELLEGLDGSESIRDFKKILKDTRNKKDPICLNFKDLFGFMVGTVSSVIMDLPQRQLHVSCGPPNKNPYQVFTFQR